MSDGMCILFERPREGLTLFERGNERDCALNMTSVPQLQ
jgi:hypothetical protein